MNKGSELKVLPQTVKAEKDWKHARSYSSKKKKNMLKVNHGCLAVKVDLGIGTNIKTVVLN